MMQSASLWIRARLPHSHGTRLAAPTPRPFLLLHPPSRFRVVSTFPLVLQIFETSRFLPFSLAPFVADSRDSYKGRHRSCRIELRDAKQQRRGRRRKCVCEGGTKHSRCERKSTRHDKALNVMIGGRGRRAQQRGKVRSWKGSVRVWRDDAEFRLKGGDVSASQGRDLAIFDARGQVFASDLSGDNTSASCMPGRKDRRSAHLEQFVGVIDVSWKRA